MHEKEFSTAAQYMSIGISYCTQNRLSSYTHIMFILCKGLVINIIYPFHLFDLNLI